MNIFKRRTSSCRFGLIGLLNKRGLGTESRALESLFKQNLQEVDFSLFHVKSMKIFNRFDEHFQNDKKFLKWLHKQTHIMVIERFFPKLFSYCKNNNIKTLWRPNYEWIDPKFDSEDFNRADYILTPQNACAEFLKEKFNLNNVQCIPWVTDLPIKTKKPHQDKSVFIFNAGHGGVGDRRNVKLVLDVFKDVLAERKDIFFIFKSQKGYEVTGFEGYKNNFSFIRKSTSYNKNLEYYLSADFSVAPSKWEGVGYALLESLHYGTPVLSIDTAPMNEWVSHKATGYLSQCTFFDVSLPIPYNRDAENPAGLNWVKAAQVNKKDLIDGIIWLADNKFKLYENFDETNKKILNNRKQAFISSFKKILL